MSRSSGASSFIKRLDANQPIANTDKASLLKAAIATEKVGLYTNDKYDISPVVGCSYTNGGYWL